MDIKDRTAKARSFIQLTDSIFTKEEFKTAFQHVIRLVNAAEANLMARIDARLAQIKDGAQGPKGDKGDSVAGPRGPKGEKGAPGMPGAPGAPGRDADVAEAVRLTLPQLLAEIDKRVPLLGDALRAGLEEHVQNTLKGYGAGGGTSFSIMQSGVPKVQQPGALDFKGAGAPTITIGQNGVTHLNFPSGGGAGITVSANDPSDPVDGSNQVYTVSDEPRWVVADGSTYFEGIDYTYGAHKVTFNVIAPSQFIRFFI